jgi:hypothetical protein
MIETAKTGKPPDQYKFFAELKNLYSSGGFPVLAVSMYLGPDSALLKWASIF